MKSSATTHFMLSNRPQKAASHNERRHGQSFNNISDVDYVDIHILLAWLRQCILCTYDYYIVSSYTGRHYTA